MIEELPNGTIFIFHSDKAEDRETRTYVETLEVYGIKILDLKNENITEEQLADVADKLGIAICELVDDEYADQLKIWPVKGLRDQDTLRMLSNEPILIDTPILIIGDHAYQFESPYDLIKETAVITSIRENPAANVEGKDET